MQHVVPFVRRRWLLAGLALALAAVVPAAQAGSATGTVASSVTLTSDCQLTANPLTFGTVSALATTVTTTTSLFVTCSPSTAYTVSMNVGTTPGATTHGGVPSRFAIDPAGDIIGYGIFQDSARSTPWGMGALVASGTGTGALQKLPVYGSLYIPSGMPPSTYTDSVTVTLSY